MLALILAVGFGCSDNNFHQIPETNQTEPDITVSTTELYFGLLDPGESASRTLTITNVGNADLTLLNIPIQDLVGGSFTMMTGGFPVTLESGASLDMAIGYIAEGTSDSGQLNVVSSDPDSPDIAVSLHGGYEGPKLKVDPPAFTFPDEMLNCEVQQRFVLSNIGSETLDLYDVRLTSGDFEITEPPAAWALQPGQQATVEVEFQPDAARLYEDVMVVDSNDPDGEYGAPLYAVGDGDGACQLLDLSFEVEYEIADIAFLIDNTNPRFTYLMEALMAQEFGDIVDELNASMEDLTFGVAIYQDYNQEPYGGNEELPFILKAQQTTNVTRVQAALTDLEDGSWFSDEPASTMEALYQAMAGQGYDQDCDRAYDDAEDVQPLRASKADVFGGRGGSTYSSASGDGQIGGMGFREGALPIVVFVTDSALRDPDNGYASPDGCDDAGSGDVERAAADLGARIIGVSMNAQNLSDVEDISDVTFSWEYHSGTIKEDLIGAIEELVGSVVFEEVWMEITSDAYNQIDGIDPQRWEYVSSGTDVDFSLTVNSALVEAPSEDSYTATVEVWGRIGDQEWHLTTHDFHILIPVSDTEE